MQTKTITIEDVARAIREYRAWQITFQEYDERVWALVGILADVSHGRLDLGPLLIDLPLEDDEGLAIADHGDGGYRVTWGANAHLQLTLSPVRWEA